MSADSYGLHTANSATETTDFCLSPEEVAKGQRAAALYINSIKAGETRRRVEEALDTLAAVISGGICGGTQFPWQQVRAYHGALAISIAKERGAPAHIEALRCRHDDNRKYRQVAEAYKPKDVQRMRTSLAGVIQQCCNLGFITDEEMDRTVSPSKRSPAAKNPRERELTEGEVRALLAACGMNSGTASCRDALMIGLAYHGGLKTVDLINLTLDDLLFDAKTGRALIRHRTPGTKRARRIPLENEDLIALEDWLEARGRKAGPLFCPINRGHVEHRRMSANAVREFCDTRSEQSGVLPFAPNDLARSSPHSAEAAKRRRMQDSPQPTAVVSPLYADAPDTQVVTETTTRISFPYRARVGR